MWKILCFFKNTEDACYYLCSAKQVLFTQCSSSGLKGKHKCFSFQAVPPEYNWVKYKVTSYWEVNWGQSLCLSTITHLGCFPAWSQPSGERWESLFPFCSSLPALGLAVLLWDPRRERIVSAVLPASFLRYRGALELVEQTSGICACC